MNPEIAIIILNFNGAYDTIECLESLRKSEVKEFNLVIVDNGSEVNDFMTLDTWCRKNFSVINLLTKDNSLKCKKNGLDFASSIITIIKNGDNLGFAAGNNIGTKFAMLNGANKILLLNNDTIVTNTFLSELIRFWKDHPWYAALTPKICLANPNDIIWNCGGKLTWFGNRRYYYSDVNVLKVPNKKFSEITFATGCALFYKPEVTGLLTEQFFFGEEDFEFSLRLLRVNLKMACVYNSIIYHKVGRSIETNYEVSYNRLFLHYVSRLIDHKTYYSGLFRLFIKNLHLIYGFYLTFIRYKFGLMNSVKFWLKVNKFVKNHNEVTRKDFSYIMKFHFNS